MKKYFDVLRKCPLFFGISDENLLTMLVCLGARVVRYSKRETIVAEGERLRNIGIVLSGSVQIIRVDYYGNRSIVSGIGPTELFGESFACADIQAVPVDIVATEDSEIMLIDCMRVMYSCGNACEFHRQIIHNLIKDIATKNLMFHRKIQITANRSTREKLMAYLMYEAKRAGSNKFEIPFDRQELADYLEVDRSGLSAEISKLRAEALIKSRKKYFELL